MKTAGSKIIVLCIAAMAALAAGAFAADIPSCHVCGMMVDEASPFSAMLITEKHTLSFCDIGDLLIYLKKNTAGRAQARVKDYRSREWIEAAKAFYVKAPQRFMTPMGWSIAAFRHSKDAVEYGAVINLENALKSVQ